MAAWYEARLWGSNQRCIRDRVTFQRWRRPAALHVLPPAGGGGAGRSLQALLRHEQRGRGGLRGGGGGGRQGLGGPAGRLRPQVSERRGAGQETVAGGENRDEKSDASKGNKIDVDEQANIIICVKRL